MVVLPAKERLELASDRLANECRGTGIQGSMLDVERRHLCFAQHWQGHAGNAEAYVGTRVGQSCANSAREALTLA